MIVVSDTNILSSLAAAQAFPLLLRLFTGSELYIPPAVYEELQLGLTRGKTYLEPVLQAIVADEIQVIDLSLTEKRLMSTMPAKLNAGESEAIALSQTRRATLLSNDKRAIRYCEKQKIQVLNLSDILRLLWLRKLISVNEVKLLISEMNTVEGLTLSQAALETIFANQRRRRRRRRRRRK